jgi:hypothetical protein
MATWDRADGALHVLDHGGEQEFGRQAVIDRKDREASLQTINVTATVKAKPGESTSAVQANVVAALQSWLSPQTWPFGQTVYTSAITSKMASVDGVDYVISLTTPGSDTTLTADKTVTAGTLTITVT